MKMDIQSQNYLRTKAKIAIAENEGDFTCADFADFLQIKIDSYYNWINRQYNLCKDKERKFNGFLDDLLL